MGVFLVYMQCMCIEVCVGVCASVVARGKGFLLKCSLCHAYTKYVT